MKILRLSFILFISLLITVGVIWVAAISESEPNDTPPQADSLLPGYEMEAAIDPSGDVDFYSIPGVNTTWGFIALLETDASISSQDGVLSAIGTDGTTVLSTDQGSWVRGSGIALQNYADAGDPHYLKVSEENDDATISDYVLRYYRTITRTQPEIEPNEIRTTGTPSSYTMEGALSSAGDVDCFAFEGHNGDMVLLAVNADPEDDGGPVDIDLELVDTGDSVLASADFTGTGGNEFLEYGPLSGDGIYAYCLSVSGGTAGTSATYHAGIVRNGYLYTSSYEGQITWTNPPPDGVAFMGDTLTFELKLTNTSPLPLPGNVEILASYNSDCLSYQTATLAPTHIGPGNIDWYGFFPGELAPGASYIIEVDMLAERACTDDFHQSTYVEYFFSGFGVDAPYSIYGIFLPLITRQVSGISYQVSAIRY